MSVLFCVFCQGDRYSTGLSPGGLSRGAGLSPGGLSRGTGLSPGGLSRGSTGLSPEGLSRELIPWYGVVRG